MYWIDWPNSSTCVTGEADCQICGLDGICLANEVHYEGVGSMGECEELCRDWPDNECNFYSYGDFNCWLFASCQFQSEASCPNCMSSQVGCATASPSTTMPPLTTSTESPDEGKTPKRHMLSPKLFFWLDTCRLNAKDLYIKSRRTCTLQPNLILIFEFLSAPPLLFLQILISS